MATASKGNHQHLTLSDRIYIEQGLERRISFKDIAKFIAKDPTTISKEIRRHRIEKSQQRTTAWGPRGRFSWLVNTPHELYVDRDTPI